MSTEPTETRAAREEILARRAAKLAAAAVTREVGAVVARIAVVQVSDQRFGLPVQWLREVLPAPPIAPLPGLPAWIAGLASIRGEIVSVVRLGALLDIEGSTETRNTRFLAVVEGREGPLALLVDAVVEFRDVAAQDIVSREEHIAGERGRPVRALTRDLVTLLDVEALLASDRIVVT
jgi:purine-binding chemotaxis protein CheW